MDKKIVLFEAEKPESKEFQDKLRETQSLELIVAEPASGVEKASGLSQVDLLVFDGDVRVEEEVQVLKNLREKNPETLLPAIVFGANQAEVNENLRRLGVMQPFFVLQISSSVDEFYSLVCQVLGIENEKSKETTHKSNKRFKADVNFINAFLASTLSTMGTMAKANDVKLASMSPLLAGEFVEVDYYASVSMNTPQFEGQMSLGFPQQTMQNIYSSISNGSTSSPENSVIMGTAGELANVIYGTTKTELLKKGLELPRALPQMTSNPQKIVFDGKNPTIYLKISSNFGVFYLFITANDLAIV